jgi:hypothetical protein
VSVLNDSTVNTGENAMRTIRVYEEIITHESAENGDYESSELYREIEIDSEEDCVFEARREIESFGHVEPSSFPFCVGSWYRTTDADVDYLTNDRAYYTIHLDGFTDEEEESIYDLLKADRYVS